MRPIIVFLYIHNTQGACTYSGLRVSGHHQIKLNTMIPNPKGYFLSYSIQPNVYIAKAYKCGSARVPLIIEVA